MFLSKSLEKVKRINRKGELHTVNLPTKSFGSYDVLINIRNRELTFIDGDSIFIIDELIGISEETELTLFFADKYIVAELQWGKLYLKDSKGKTYHVTETGSVSRRKVDEDSIKWLSQADLLVYLGIVVKNKYNLPNDRLAKEYIDNLSITVITANEQIRNTENLDSIQYMFRIKVTEYYDDLGLEMFDYKVYEQEGNLVQVKDDNDCKTDWEEERRKEKEEKRKEKEEKRKEKKVELEYRRLRDGDDFNETDSEDMELEDYDDDELYELNGYTITDTDEEE